MADTADINGLQKRSIKKISPTGNASTGADVRITRNGHAQNHTGPPNKAPFIFLSFLVLLVAAVLGISVLNYVKLSIPEVCDMKMAENRDFNKYYGILNMRNHFITPNADDCASTILFKPALPQTILKPDYSASSFLTLAPYGTGKTLLRCEYYKSIRSDTYFKVLILNKEIDEYLQRFIEEKAMSGTDCDKKSCIMKWSSDEFGQLLLSLLVTQFVNTFETESVDLLDISLAEKMELITIMCYYYNEGSVSKLEKLVSSLLKKTGSSMYRASKAEIQIKERHLYRNKPLLTHFLTDLKKLSALRQDQEKLHLLLAIIEGERFQTKALQTTLSSNVLNDLRHFALFMKNHIKKTAVFIIDGIDDSRFFFNENNVNKQSLELFCRSSIAQEILLAAAPQNFYLSIFYPKIDGINIQDANSRSSNFPIHTINWDTKLIIDYADYILQEMNKNASPSRCKSFTNFKTLVNYSNTRNAEIINQITTPRALHYFMQHLITEMNQRTDDGSAPFIASFENIHAAYETGAKSTFKVHFINK
ncbi:unnamed protein product [Adineta steineri]|uniref:Uncharacterized protein n=1 Tax=Adineta steineri TaxID=433720 RepID=A0A813ZJI3_9BILA|nr:unnamed protein product [Adineta steineri]CAF3615504.1 unnamed protein product [Adineta steineri]